ncbi:hypothetical protein [Lysinibacillus sp. SGAir0095]|uniref:hypothetical protein n=1 Tax=Lysinibacillus sp. SGAir0095 TaxID=2070463 RepID=UPI0010CCFCBD|nr:hypothetical protein [Lysinibacillus sp. SGAir0095]QCR31204.1 hypothetical protein C1N55_03090 [Lysinibacillus sp. SGAir0095]
MAFGVAIFILIVGLVLAFYFTLGKSIKRKFIIWGITTMFAIAPFFTWLVSISFAIMVGDGFAGIGLMLIMFPIILLIGIVLLLVGIFIKPKQLQLKEL